MNATDVERDLRLAHRRQPWLPAPDAALLARVRETLARDPRAKLHLHDLLLAEGCARGDARALAELERVVMPKVKQAISRVDASAAFVDEALQAVRSRLLTREGGGEPRVRQYTGEGPLVNWARVASMRIALNVKRAHRGGSDEPSGDLDEPLPSASPELALMRANLAGKFKTALQDALATLTPADRNLLRLHFVDGLSLDELGAMVGAHKSTMSRRLAKLQETLVDESRAALQRRWGIRSRELSSVMKLFSQRVELSVRGALGPREPD
ncbi:MAG: sigma-70 family RNA polymerase sigma factor [Myxococcaceae bacterium]|nr:sigma-70 family RNA polymerase sigma factor [Myxococcaceae bacterium]